MTPAQKIRKGLYAKAHIGKKNLGIDDETWKAIIERLTQGRADSCAGCSISELEALVKELARKGFQASPPREKADDFEINPNDPAARHLRKLTAVFFDLVRVGAVQTKSAKRSLRKFVKRVTGVDDLRWLSPQQCNSVIEACKAWKKRFLLRHPIAEENRPGGGAIPASAIVKAGVFDAMRLVGEAGTPIEGIRNVLVLLDAQNFADAQIAAQVADLVREFGERARQALLKWDFKKVRGELCWLVERVAEVDRTIAEGMRSALKADADETETPGAVRGPRNKNSTRGDL